MELLEKTLAKLKRTREILAEKKAFDPSILPAHTDYLGIFNNNARLTDLLTGAKFFQFDPVLGHRYRKNSAILLLRQNHANVEKYLCITDQDGFVPNSLQFESTQERLKKAKKMGMKSIFIFGGSTVAHCSGYLPDTEIAAHLENQLQLLYPDKYIVVNAGTGGYATDNQFKYLIYDVLPLRPDIVIFYDGWNDATYLNGLLTTYQDNYKRGSVQQSYSAKKLYENSMSVKKMFKQTNKLALRVFLEKLDRFNLFSKWFPKLALHPIGESITDCVFNPLSLEIYANNIFMAHAVCEAYGVRFLHFLQPLLVTGTKPLTPIEQHYFNKVPNPDIHLYQQFFNLFESRNFNGANVLQPVQSISLRTVFDAETRHIFKDMGHIESLGNQIVANHILKAFQF